jgi:glycosyltransferase involved in cell wall biosynthesis
MIVALCVLCLACAAIPAVLFCMNLREYVAPPTVSETLAAVSILIPARNEAAAIGAALSNALSSRGVEFEVVVMDDGSTDGTDAIVLAIAANDARVRLERAPALPAGWNGKQHACWALAQAAKNPVLCFVDADVLLGPDCVARMAGFMESGGSALVSGFPRQITVTFLEWMLLPLIHFVLLGFLPIGRMRRGTDPAFAAGCGQFILCRREAYFACGGHSEIKLTMHDGLLLPRLFRVAGFRTDLADITLLASCRMYTSAAQVWNGLAKNATEGLAAPARIVPISLVLLMGQVVPFAYFLFLLCFLLRSISAVLSVLIHHTYIFGITYWGALILTSMAASLLLVWFVRSASAVRFRQDWRSALLHPVGILLLLAVQWYALLRKLRGRTVSWRGRAYAGDQKKK